MIIRTSETLAARSPDACCKLKIGAYFYWPVSRWMLFNRGLDADFQLAHARVRSCRFSDDNAGTCGNQACNPAAASSRSRSGATSSGAAAAGPGRRVETGHRPDKATINVGRVETSHGAGKVTDSTGRRGKAAATAEAADGAAASELREFRGPAYHGPTYDGSRPPVEPVRANPGPKPNPVGQNVYSTASTPGYKPAPPRLHINPVPPPPTVTRSAPTVAHPTGTASAPITPPKKTP